MALSKSFTLASLRKQVVARYRMCTLVWHLPLAPPFFLQGNSPFIGYRTLLTVLRENPIQERDNGVEDLESITGSSVTNSSMSQKSQ
jgi:hypothetical protein